MTVRTAIVGCGTIAHWHLDAIERELSWLERPRQVDTLFFGGGTPTYLPLEKLARLLTIVLRWFPLASLDRAAVSQLARKIAAASGVVTQIHARNQD